MLFERFIKKSVSTFCWHASKYFIKMKKTLLQFLLLGAFLPVFSQTVFSPTGQTNEIGMLAQGMSPSMQYAAGVNQLNSQPAIWNITDNMVIEYAGTGNFIAINNAGTAVGECMGSGSDKLPCLANIADETVTYLYMESGVDAGGSAYAINADGSLIVGFYYSSDWNTHACVWKNGGQTAADRVELPKPTEAQFGDAIDYVSARWMSEDGSVILGYAQDGSNGMWVMVYWTLGNDGSYVVHAEHALRYFTSSGWDGEANSWSHPENPFSCFEANAISANGEWISLTVRATYDLNDWDANPPMQAARLNLVTDSLEVLPVSESMVGYSIANDGTVVGASESDGLVWFSGRLATCRLQQWFPNEAYFNVASAEYKISGVSADAAYVVGYRRNPAGVSDDGEVTSFFAHLQFPKCGENLYWFIEDSTLVIVGSGAMYEYESTNYIPWITKSYQISSISLPAGLTSIGGRAFDGVFRLRSLMIPDSVTSIGEGAFRDCFGLSSFSIPESVTSIASSAFINCSGLTSITIPNSVTKVENWTFCNCSSLSTVIIPNSVTSIGEYAFSGCSGLTEVTIGNSVANIGLYAFENCNSLVSITCLAVTPPFVTTSCFSDLSIPVYVPESAVETYRNADGWSEFPNIRAIGAVGEWSFSVEQDGLFYFVNAVFDVYADSISIDSVRLEISTNDTLWLPLTGDLVSVDGNYLSAEIPFGAFRPGTYGIRAVAVVGDKHCLSAVSTMEIGGSVVVDDGAITEGTVAYDETSSTLTISGAVIEDAVVAITNMLDDAVIEFTGASTIIAADAGILTSGDVVLHGTYEGTVDTTTIISAHPLCASAEGVKITFNGVALHLVIPQDERGAVPSRVAARRQMTPMLRACYIAHTVLLTGDASSESVISGFDEVDFINCGIVYPMGAEYDEDNLELTNNGEPVYNCTILPTYLPLSARATSDQVSVQKYLLNGQVVILRDGVRYNAMGAMIR